MLVILEIQLIIYVKRRNMCDRLLAILYLIYHVTLLQDTVPVSKRVRYVFSIVVQCDVQHAFLAICPVVVDRSSDVVVFHPVGSCHGFTIDDSLVREIEYLFVLAIPFKITSAPLHQCRE